MALRWKKEPRETGLAAVGRNSSCRPSTLHENGEEYATVYNHAYHVLQGNDDSWYWVAAHSLIPYRNTCNEPRLTQEEAKTQAKAYVLQHLNRKK